VLSIGVMKASGGGGAGGGTGVDYYRKAVAEGVEEYYQGVGEAPGEWIGRSAREALGLHGEVATPDLEAVFAGADPATGVRLGVFTKREVIGFDLTFRAPKSVSILFGLGTPEIAAAVRDAHEAAVNAAFGWIETNVARTRTGKGGMNQVRVDGLTAAKFRHRTSRAGDPHLHTHVLVANMAQGPDGRWRTLDGRMIFTHASTGGYLYEAQLRHELTERLGVGWEPAVNGIADLTGVDKSVLSHFSDRRKAIEEHLDKVGFRTARAAQIATLATRTAKDTSLTDGVTMRDVWVDKAAEIGFDPAALGRLVGQAALQPVTDDIRAELFAHLAGPEGLTARASTFDRRAVLQSVAQALRTGAPVSDIEGLADAFLASPEVVRILDPEAQVGLTYRDVIRRADGTIVATPTPGRWSTRDLVAIEQRLVAGAMARQGDGSGLVDAGTLEAALAQRPTLSVEQSDMVVRLTTGGHGVDVVSAAAGTGKTFTLDAARHAWEAAGYKVVGAAHTGQAARELQASAAISSFTLAMLQIDLDAARTRLSDRTVLIVDEAGMAGTRTLAPILDTAHAAGAKVILVGDPRQLPEIDAGGVLAGLAQRLDAIELNENRRQRAVWERAALEQLRDGDVDAALDAYRRHDRIITAATAPALRSVMVADWWSWRIGGEHAAMITTRNSDADDLNARARAYRQRAGQLHGPELVIDDRPYQRGDEILCRRNDYRLDVRNGTRGTVTHVDIKRRAVTIAVDDRSVTLPSEYLDAGHISHAYAFTVWKTQGATFDRGLLLGTDELFRERGYVGLSRGRDSNHLYMNGGTEPDLSTSHGRPVAPPDAGDLVEHALARSTVQRLAIDSGDVVDVRDIEDLVAEKHRLTKILAAAPADRTQDIEALEARANDYRRELAPTAERYNELADHRIKRKAARQEMAMLDDRIRHINAALTNIEVELAGAQRTQLERVRFLDDNEPARRRLEGLTTELSDRVARRVLDHLADPPVHLTERLGERPTDETRLAAWVKGATIIEAHRVEASVTDEEHAFGATSDGLPRPVPAEVRLDLLLITQDLRPPPSRDPGLELSL